jgi:alkyldihydroxyacetonephosphate synthase
MSLARPTDPYPDPSWWGWGDPSNAAELPEQVLALLADALGVQPAEDDSPPSTLDVLLPASRLDGELSARLASVVGAEHAFDDDDTRLRHTRGKSTVDLLRIRAGDADDAPDLVLLPGSHEEVLELLGICSRQSIAVVPFGGGTSVVGGLQPDADRYAGLVALDLRRMNRLLALDQESRLAVLEPGLRGPQAEALLASHGYTIGHFPQSFEYATLGGFAAARSSGQASAGYGRFDELVDALRVATPSGTLALGRAPKSAAGPDLRQMFLGSEGALGVITSITIQVRPAPERRVYEGWWFASFAEGAAVLRQLAQDGPVPTVVRLSDEAETALNLTRPSELGGGPERGGCLAVVGYEGSSEALERRRDAATRVLELAGAQPEPDAGERWERERFRLPYLRDALLGVGVLVETLETATFWSSLQELHDAVARALRESLTAQGSPPFVLCHISHVYAAGASLYFTIGCAQLEDPVAQWRAAKTAASEAIAAAGGSISHHHGIGRDHRDWLENEVGELGVEVLRAIKSRLDPSGILNPGVLIPPG